MSAKSIAEKYTPTAATLRSDLQTLKTDLDTLVTHAVDLTDAELSEQYERLLGKVDTLRVSARRIASKANEHIHHGVEVSTDYVKEKPRQSLAIALAAGLLLGIALARK